MEMKILGTVAPYCKNGKNCSGYLIKTKDQNILLDCGNGITNLLNLGEDLENMTIILSHLHPDHYGDLLSLAPSVDLYHKFGYLNNKVKLYIPEANYEEIDEHYTDEDGWGSIRTVKKPLIDDELIRRIGRNHYFDLEEYNDNSKIQIGNININFFKTLHPINTFAVKLQDETGTISYSADTGYDDDLIDFFKNSDILLCESTFLKGQLKSSNNHLYAYEAAILAKNAEVSQLVLTHFWPDEDKQKYVDEASKIFKNTIEAEEGKILKLIK